MGVYQAISKTQLYFCYDRYNLEEGQLLAVNQPKLEGFLKSHHGFVEVYDEDLIRMAPPLHLIRDPQDPYRMRKQDVIKELRSYGIAVDPYEFSDSLTMKLQVARKMLKRNFVTVLNEEGVPVYIDTIKIQPAINSLDENIPEPEEPKGEFFEIDDEDEALDDIEKHPYRAKSSKKNKVSKLPKDRAMEVTTVYDENVINDGKDYSEFLKDIAEKEYRANIEKEAEVQDMLEPKKAPPTPEELDPELVTMSLEDIKGDNFKHLVDMDKDKKFIMEEPTDEEKEKMYEVKWTKIDIEVCENILRNHGVEIDYTLEGINKRWGIINAVKDLVETQKNEQNFYIEINMLQRRHVEIAKMEPSYRNFTVISIKKRLTELRNHGVDTWYGKNDNVKVLCKKMYALAKLGLQVPDKIEDIDALLKQHDRGNLI